MFADLPSSYLLNPECVDKGQYIDHGSFGDIYRGAVYPSVNATVSVVAVENLICISEDFFQDYLIES